MKKGHSCWWKSQQLLNEGPQQLEKRSQQLEKRSQQLEKRPQQLEEGLTLQAKQHDCLSKMMYCTHIYCNRLADLPVDDSRISPEMLVHSWAVTIIINSNYCLTYDKQVGRMSSTKYRYNLSCQPLKYMYASPLVTHLKTGARYISNSAQSKCIHHQICRYFYI
jgi:hypothetical protein